MKTSLLIAVVVMCVSTNHAVSPPHLASEVAEIIARVKDQTQQEEVAVDSEDKRSIEGEPEGAKAARVLKQGKEAEKRAVNSGSQHFLRQAAVDAAKKAWF